jgi:hypothetical protein
MSAYSTSDIEKAFDCAKRLANEVEPIFITQDRVMAHLTGSCSCDLDRCPQCKERRRNGRPIHKPHCKMGTTR